MLLLVTADEEASFWLACVFLEDLVPSNFHGEGLCGAEVECHVFEELLASIKSGASWIGIPVTSLSAAITASVYCCEPAMPVPMISPVQQRSVVLIQPACLALLPC